MNAKQLVNNMRGMYVQVAVCVKHLTVNAKKIEFNMLQCLDTSNCVILVPAPNADSGRTIFEPRKFSTYVAALKALVIFSFSFRLSAFIPRLNKVTSDCRFEPIVKE